MEYAVPLFIRRRWMARESRVKPNRYGGSKSWLGRLLNEEGMKTENIREAICPDMVRKWHQNIKVQVNQLREVKC